MYLIAAVFVGSKKFSYPHLSKEDLLQMANWDLKSLCLLLNKNI